MAVAWHGQVFSGKVGGVAMVPLKTQSFLNTEGVSLKNFPRHCVGRIFEIGHVLEGYLKQGGCWKDI
ncbi:unnamed protein product [Prunus armeniaca]